MKIWIKLLIGSGLGIALGFLLPGGNQNILSALSRLEKLAIGIGRYALIPALVFSLTMAVYELRQDGRFWALVLKNILFIAGISLFVIAAGILATTLFPPARIPIEKVEQVEIISLNPAGNILDLFPSNMLSIFAGDGVYLFPVCVFAFFFGIGLSYDRGHTKPAITLTDSLARIFYQIAAFFSEILGFVIIVLSAYWAIRFREALQTDVFRSLVVLLGVMSAVIGFGALPLLLYFLRSKSAEQKINPWRVLYGSLGPALAAFFSGDINFSFPVLLRHSTENFGIKRHSSAVSLCLTSTFCRAGSAMVAAAAFIVIIKSYSYLPIPVRDLASIGLRAFLISFLLARYPGNGAYTALAALSLSYGRSFEAGYLLLKPLIFYLTAVGTFLDVMISFFVTYAAAWTGGLVEEKNAARFI